MLAKNFETSKIIFSDDCRFVLGSDKRWRYIRRGEWNEACFAVEEKFPESLLTWGAVGFNFQAGCQFCSNDVDSSEYRCLLVQPEMVETMNDRFRKYKWTFMQDSASVHTATATTWFLRF
jgi:hypothetical protein